MLLYRVLECQRTNGVYVDSTTAQIAAALRGEEPELLHTSGELGKAIPETEWQIDHLWVFVNSAKLTHMAK